MLLPVERNGLVTPPGFHHIHWAAVSMPPWAAGHTSGKSPPTPSLGSPTASVPIAPAVTAPALLTQPPLVVVSLPVPALQVAICALTSAWVGPTVLLDRLTPVAQTSHSTPPV